MAMSSQSLESTIEEKDLKYHEHIGRGGSGEVFRGTWTSKDCGDTEVALKKIFRDKDKNLEEQFGNEINFLRRLQHPNIIKYYGHVIIPTYVVIVTEYAAKGSLYDYLKTQSQLPDDLKKKWRIQAAKGIRYLQELNILHRDIKSPNFFITAEDDLKLGDFGIAKILTTTTSTQTDRGTIQWQAPEVFKENQLSLKADIFALGVVLWELETCEVPYKEFQDGNHLMFAIGSNDIRPDIPESCSPRLCILIQQCWDKDRTKRPHIDAVVSRLCDINDETEEEVKQESGIADSGKETFGSKYPVSYDIMMIDKVKGGFDISLSSLSSLYSASICAAYRAQVLAWGAFFVQVRINYKG